MRTIYLVPMILSAMLMGCSPLTTDNPKAPICRAIVDNMIFQPQTSNIRRSEIEGSEVPLERHDYDTHRCGG